MPVITGVRAGAGLGLRAEDIILKFLCRNTLANIEKCAWEARIETLSLAGLKAQLSADWLARLQASTSPDAWVHGFSMHTTLRRHNLRTMTGFTRRNPDTFDGVVATRAYVVALSDQASMGYATEAARALVSYAFSIDHVSLVRAHTLPASNASKRVLTKCGFQYVGDIRASRMGLPMCKIRDQSANLSNEDCMKRLTMICAPLLLIGCGLQ